MTAYHRPTDLQDALAVLAEGPVTVAAGCTDLFPATQAKSLAGPVLDITAIDALRGVTRDDDGWRIGATTTWTDILRADLPPAFDGLKLAAREVGSVQIQNAGTVAGNLCTASPAADSVPCLLTLDASVELRSVRETRVVPIGDFLTGPRRTDLRAGEIVTAVHVPESSAAGQGHFLKLGARRYLIISIAMVAVRVEATGGLVTQAALAAGACSPVATRLPNMERTLQGKALTALPDLVHSDLVTPHLSPIGDIRADAGYRIEAATELLRRALAVTLTQRAAA